MSARNQKGVPLAGHDLVEVVGEEVEEVEVKHNDVVFIMQAYLPSQHSI